MKVVLIWLIFVLVAVDVLQIVECRSVKTLNDAEETGSGKMKNQKISLKEIKQYGTKLKSLLPFVSKETVRDILLSSDCDENGVDSVIGDWDHCINLTIAIADLEEVGKEWYQYRLVVETLLVDLYTNVSSCELMSLLDEAICVAKSFQAVIPDYAIVIDALINVLEDTDLAVVHVEDEFIKCFNLSNITSKVLKACNRGSKLLKLSRVLFSND